MNILTTVYYPANKGGAEASTYLTAKELNKTGLNVSIASTGEYPGINTFVFRKYNPIIPLLSLQSEYLKRFLVRVIKENGIDLLHAQDRLTSIGAIKAAQECKIPCVVHFRDYWFACPESSCLRPDYFECDVCNLKNVVHCSKKRLLWNIYKNYSIRRSLPVLDGADIKIAISGAVKRKLESCGIKDAVILPNPVDCDVFSCASGEKIREEYGLEGTVVTYIGALAYHKGILNIIKIMPDIVKKSQNVRFLVVGDGELKKKCMEEVKKHGISEKVVFAGKIPLDRMPEVYAASDIILFPSIWQEPFGRVAVEAMAGGKPVIASRVGGITDIIEDGKTGLLVEPMDLEGWERTITTLIKNNELSQWLGFTGQDIARERYDKKIIAIKIQELYDSTLIS